MTAFHRASWICLSQGIDESVEFRSSCYSERAGHETNCIIALTLVILPDLLRSRMDTPMGR